MTKTITPHDSSCKTIVVNPSADVPSTKLDALRESDKQADPTWNRKLRCKDQSAEAYHLKLIKLARKAGWEEQDVVDLCITWSRKHGESLILRDGYYVRLLAKVDAELEREQSLLRIERGEISSRDVALQELSSLLEVSVVSIQRFKTDPRSYVMRLGNGSYIEFKTGSELFTQPKLAGALVDYANVIMPTFKSAEWMNVMRCAMKCIEDVESSADSTHLGATIDHLRTYIRKHLRPELERDGQLISALNGRPAVIDDQIWFSMEGLMRSIMLESSEQPAKRLLAVRLEQIGCVYEARKSLRPSGESNTTRSLWCVPNKVLSDESESLSERI